MSGVVFFQSTHSSCERRKIMINRVIKSTMCVLALMLMTAGCGGSSATAPVTGIVTLDGNPVFPARVTFTPKADSGSTDAGVPSSASTEPDGSYSIDAAQIGENIVGVMVLPTDEDSDEAEDNERPPVAGKPEKASYSVVSGSNQIDIKLTVSAPLAKSGRRRGEDDDD